VSFVVNETYPPSGDAPAASADLAGIRNNYSAIETFFTTTKHYTFTSALSGQHIPGVAGLINYSTGVGLPSTPPSGALWVNTAYGEIFRGNGSDWRSLPISGTTSKILWSCMNLYQLFITGAPSATLTTLALSAVGVPGMEGDLLSEWSTVNKRFTVKSEGYYLVSFDCSPSGLSSIASSPYTLELFIYVTSGGISAPTTLATYRNYMMATSHTVQDIIPLVAGDYIEFKARHNISSSTVAGYTAGASIVRLS
jgi:hypothetical protein